MKRSRQGTSETVEPRSKPTPLEMQGKKTKTEPAPRSYVFRAIRDDDRHNLVGAPVAIDKEGLGAKSGVFQLGIVKFYLPKWDMFFIHMYSLEEGVTEFPTLPKALKFVNSRLHLTGDTDLDIGVDFSTLSKDRFWLNRSQMSGLELLSDKQVWHRPSREGLWAASHRPSHDWRECAECKYLIDEVSGEKYVSCSACSADYHEDCLYHFEKLLGPGQDEVLLDAQGRKYESAAKKWKARKTSKNPSLLLDDSPAEPDIVAAPSVISPSSFTCANCRDCRYCCGSLHQEVLPSSSLLSIEPFVVCRKCNAAAHGWCVFPAVPRLHACVEWVCDDCRQCNSCGRVTYLAESSSGMMPSLLTDWALPSFDQCKQCFAGLDKGEYCPMCMKAWTQEWGGDMVQCDLCEFWVHVNCDNLGSVTLNKLAHSEVKYTCPICRDNTEVHRRRRVIDLLRTIDKVGLFSEPVTASLLGIYLKVIKSPMDLAKMRSKNEADLYPSNVEFIQDFELIVDNAKIFNMPNSPAYRLAEQFHKQGKLLIEKYLLVTRRGAQMVEGLAAVSDPAAHNEEDLLLSSTKRQASIQAATSWQKTIPKAAAAQRKLTYNDIIESIKKGRIEFPKPISSSSPPAQISPYRKKALTLLSSSPVKDEASSSKNVSNPPSGVNTPLAGSYPELSPGDIKNLLKKIFGLADSWFLDQQPPSRAESFFALPLDTDFSILGCCCLPPTTIAKSLRWCLHEVCGICNAFGDPGSFVDCTDCGDSFHYYCVGLAGIWETLGSPNPLRTGGTPTSPQRGGYKCPSCVRCRFCQNRTTTTLDTTEITQCCLCGATSHLSCREKVFSSPVFTVGGEGTGWPVLSVCDSCPLDHALRWFKAPYCKGCDCALHPAAAAAFLKALPGNGENQNSEKTFSLSLKPTPVVNCVGCGASWHTRCLPEFAEIAAADVQGMYLCVECSGRWGGNCFDDSTIAAANLDEWLNSMNAVLRSFKQDVFRETQLDLIIETLRSVGLDGFFSRSHPFLIDFMEIFACASGCVPSGPSGVDQPSGGVIDPASRAWVEWGLLHKDFLLALAPTGEGTLKKKSTKNLDENSIRVRRAEDEDLLLARRLYGVWKLLTGQEEKMENNDKMFSETEKIIDETKTTRLQPFPQDVSPKLFSSGENGARLLQLWLTRVDRGYTGPGSDNPISLPSFETRNCAFCNCPGDHAVMGELLVFGPQKWVHSECLAWVTGHENVPAAMADAKFLPVSILPGLAEPPTPTIVSSDEIESILSESVLGCASCGNPGATIRCQQCRQTCFHLPCAVLANGDKLVMDSRCRLLTCARCLYRTPELAKALEIQFAAARTGVRFTHSIKGQLTLFRRFVNRVVVQGAHVVGQAGEMLSGVRCGPLTIVRRGSFGSGADYFHYDGSITNLIPEKNFASIRLFYAIEIPLSGAELSEFVPKKSDQLLLRKAKRVAYLNRVENGRCSIEILGGRVVAVGASLDECFAEFKHMFVSDNNGYRFPSYMTARWFFGLDSRYMREYMHGIAMKSIKRQASLSRTEWLYHPQLRSAVTEALGLKADTLTTLVSWRRGNRDNKQNIDQLKSLGRLICDKQSSCFSSQIAHLLDPGLVTKSVSLSDGNNKPSRGMTAAGGDGPAAGKYKTRTAIADMDVLEVRRSVIHNYGLFAGKMGFSKGDYVVEYQGEILRETVADDREKKAERAGNGDGGSCYMFRLDDDYIVDATVKGNCARFINHSCQANCACKMIEDENRKKHIMIIAKKDIAPNEEITYDYQFAVESEKLACLCGAPNCLGRLN